MPAEGFVDQLWNLDERALVKFIAARHPDDGDYQTGLAVLQAKVMLASRRTATWTMWLTIATAALAVLALVSIWQR